MVVEGFALRPDISLTTFHAAVCWFVMELFDGLNFSFNVFSCGVYISIFKRVVGSFEFAQVLCGVRSFCLYE